MSPKVARQVERITACLFTALIVLSLTPVPTQAQNEVGYVKDMVGEWLLNGRPLKRSQSLPPRGRITFQPTITQHSFITIADRNGRPIIYRNCDNQGECSRAIILPDVDPSEQGLASKIVGIARRLLFGNDEEYDSAISRGGVGALQESVVKLEGDKVDLSPTFANMSRGQYLLRFVPKSRRANATQDAGLNMIPFNWNPQNPATLSVRGLTPGTYELQLLSLQDREQLEPGTEAWVLVTNGADYEKALCSYMQAVAITSQWGKDTRPEAVRSFLRAYLKYLAMPEKK